MRSAAFAVYRLAAVPAEHFSFQQENRVATYLSYAIDFDPLPNLLEGFRRYDGRVCVSVNFTVYFVNADIFLVVQNIIDRVRKKTLTVVGYTALFQKGYYVFCHTTVCVHIEHFENDCRPRFVYYDLFIYYFVSDRNASARKQPLVAVFLQTSAYFLRKFGRIIFGKSDINVFEQDTVEVFRAVYVLRSPLGGGLSVLPFFFNRCLFTATSMEFLPKRSIA